MSAASRQAQRLTATPPVGESAVCIMTLISRITRNVFRQWLPLAPGTTMSWTASWGGTNTATSAYRRVNRPGQHRALLVGKLLTHANRELAVRHRDLDFPPEFTGPKPER